MTVYIARSTDASAPVLSGQVGALIPVLDYCLVTTMGWTKTVLATNQAAYQAPSGLQRFFQVDDTFTTYAHVSGWETLTAFNTGTNPFPNAVQISNTFATIDKSITADSTARAWKMFSNGTLFHFITNRGPANICPTTFGDFISYRPGDVYNAILAVGQANSGGSGNAGWPNTCASSFSEAQDLPYVTVNRSADGFTQQVYPAHFPMNGIFTECSRSSNSSLAGRHVMGTLGPAFPDAINGGANLSPCWVGEFNATLYQTYLVRGLVPGVWEPWHASGLVDGDTFNCTTGLLAGRSFEVSHNGTDSATIVYETSNTWGGF